MFFHHLKKYIIFRCRDGLNKFGDKQTIFMRFFLWGSEIMFFIGKSLQDSTIIFLNKFKETTFNLLSIKTKIYKDIIILTFK